MSKSRILVRGPDPPPKVVEICTSVTEKVFCSPNPESKSGAQTLHPKSNYVLATAVTESQQSKSRIQNLSPVSGTSYLDPRGAVCKRGVKNPDLESRVQVQASAGMVHHSLHRRAALQEGRST
jgi:hypothetical protein